MKGGIDLHIFKENNRIRLQLMDLKTNKMLFDFTIEKDLGLLRDLKNHIKQSIEHFIKENEESLTQT